MDPLNLDDIPGRVATRLAPDPANPMPSRSSVYPTQPAQVPSSAVLAGDQGMPTRGSFIDRPAVAPSAARTALSGANISNDGALAARVPSAPAAPAAPAPSPAPAAPVTNFARNALGNANISNDGALSARTGPLAGQNPGPFSGSSSGGAPPAGASPAAPVAAAGEGGIPGIVSRAAGTAGRFLRSAGTGAAALFGAKNLVDSAADINQGNYVRGGAEGAIGAAGVLPMVARMAPRFLAPFAELSPPVLTGVLAANVAAPYINSPKFDAMQDRVRAWLRGGSPDNPGYQTHGTAQLTPDAQARLTANPGLTKPLDIDFKPRGSVPAAPAGSAPAPMAPVAAQGGAQLNLSGMSPRQQLAMIQRFTDPRMRQEALAAWATKYGASGDAGAIAAPSGPVSRAARRAAVMRAPSSEPLFAGTGGDAYASGAWNAAPTHGTMTAYGGPSASQTFGTTELPPMPDSSTPGFDGNVSVMRGSEPERIASPDGMGGMVERYANMPRLDGTDKASLLRAVLEAQANGMPGVANALLRAYGPEAQGEATVGAAQERAAGDVGAASEHARGQIESTNINAKAPKPFQGQMLLNPLNGTTEVRPPQVFYPETGTWQQAPAPDKRAIVNQAEFDNQAAQLAKRDGLTIDQAKQKLSNYRRVGP